jgi:signal transduction histidine kinase
MDLQASQGDLREELDRFLRSEGESGAVRREIVSSWQRCITAGLHPDRLEVPYQPDVDDGGRLSWAAGPVIDRMAEDLNGSGIGLLLTDERGHVIDRRATESATLHSLDRIELAPGFLYSEARVGTNAIGTAIAQRSSCVVTGPEHFVDALTRMACTASPITDPTGRLIGVVDLTCIAGDFSPLMLPLVKRAAWDIGQRFLQAGPAVDLRDRQAGMAPRGWSSLTATERTVAKLVAEGLTNREAGARMLVSPHTIDFHLRRIFGKLGVRSRVALARVIELASANARVVAAADEARRRIERDLHDGLQQRLVSLGLEVRLAEAAVPTQDWELKQELARVVEGLMDVLENLREISRGIHPAILSERGLGPAIRALARRSPVPVEFDIRLEDRFSEPVEIGAYYIVSEALANVAKHARAELVRVSVELRHGFLAVSIQDDGVGGADANGSGLTGLAERVEALGGAMQLVSPPGSGTVVYVELPTEAA